MCSTDFKWLTSKQVATAIGVSESTIKRWIDDGKLLANKTSGGHRRVDMNHLYTFISSNNITIKNPESLGIGGNFDPENIDELKEATNSALRVGDTLKLKQIVHQLKIFKRSNTWICDSIIHPSYSALRVTCIHPSEECLVLHRALQCIIDLVTDMMLSAETPADTENVYLADIGYDVDCIPVYLAQSCIYDLCNSVQMGADIPPLVLEGVIKNKKPKLLWISACGPVKDKKLTSKLKKIIELAEEHGTKVCIYGDFAEKVSGQNVFPMQSFSEFRGFVRAADLVRKK